MADFCEGCGEPIKDHWEESANGEYSFCSFDCEERWQKRKKLKITKDLIKGRGIILRIKQKNTEQDSFLFCDYVEYMHDKGKDKMFGQIFDHHLMIWNKHDLIFKVWLPNDSKDKEFKDVFQAIKSVGMSIHY